MLERNCKIEYPPTGRLEDYNSRFNHHSIANPESPVYKDQRKVPLSTTSTFTMTNAILRPPTRHHSMINAPNLKDIQLKLHHEIPPRFLIHIIQTSSRFEILVKAIYRTAATLELATQTTAVDDTVVCDS